MENIINQNQPFFSILSRQFKKITYHDLIIFLIPVIIFGYYLYVFNPAIIFFDNYYQFHQIATNNFNNWHPFFHTFILMVFLKIFKTPLAISIFQILTFSTMWTVICKYLRNENLKSNKTFILQVILTLIISLIPLNAIYSIFLYKDILFSYCLMFLCFLIKVIVDKKGQISFSFLFVLTVTMAFVAQLRPNGICIILLLLIVLAIYFFKNNKSQKFYILIPVLTITFILLISSLSIVYDVEDYQKDAVLTKSLHMLAEYDITHELNKDDQEKLNKVISEELIKSNYDITLSDPIGVPPDKVVPNKDKENIYFLAIEYSLKNPKHCIKYLLGSSPIVWKIFKEDDWAHYAGWDTYLIPDYSNIYFNYVNEVPVADYEKATFENSETPEFKNLVNIMHKIASNMIVDTLLDSPALYMYLSFIILGAAYLITESKELWFVYLPNFINIILVFFSMPASQIRYLYPNFLVFYLLILIIISNFDKYLPKKVKF